MIRPNTLRGRRWKQKGLFMASSMGPETEKLMAHSRESSTNLMKWTVLSMKCCYPPLVADLVNGCHGHGQWPMAMSGCDSLQALACHTL